MKTVQYILHGKGMFFCVLSVCLLSFVENTNASKLNTPSSINNLEYKMDTTNCNNCIDLGLDTIPPCGPNAYYVDATNGSDSNNGSMSAPWASISKARTTAPSGATICVLPGNYGNYTESSPPPINQRQTIRGVPGQNRPILTGLSIEYATLQESYLTLSGLAVQANKTGEVVKIKSTNNLRINDFDIQNSSWAINNKASIGIEFRETENTIFDNTKISSVHRGIQVISSSGIRILRNFIHPQAGTGIQYLAGNTNGEIAYNNIQGADYVPYPANPDAVMSPHASIISFRSGDVVLRGNHLHGMGSSSGIMFYQPDAAGGEAAYSNILVENNAIYHVHNTYAVRIYNLGSNFTLRNNTLFSRLRTGPCNGIINDNRYRFSNSIVVHNQGPGSDGIRLYNNALFGIVSISADRIYEESNNFAWSWNGNVWLSTSPSGTSTIVATGHGGCGTHDPILENGTVLANFDSITDFFATRAPRDFSPAPNSPLIDAGNVNFQPSTSLGIVQSDGFLDLCPPGRDASNSSIGAFEDGSCMPPVFDCNGDINGTAYIDSCGNCVGGNTGATPCMPTTCTGNNRFTPIIDGLQDVGWNGIQREYMRTPVIGNVTNNADLSGYFKFTWDNSFAYFLVDIKDDTLINDQSSSFVHDDGVSIYIDGGNEKAGTYDSNDNNFIVRLFDTDIRYNGTYNPPGVTKAETITEAGYVIELRIPWTVIGTTPTEGELIGLDVHINDDDDGGLRDRKLTWFSTNDDAWIDPSVLGEYELITPCDTRKVLVQLGASLEGAFDQGTSSMRHDFYTRDLLPAQQPYSTLPWNYTGEEGQGWTKPDYPPQAVDWVLVSLRETPALQSELGKVAAVLLSDGSIMPFEIGVPDDITQVYLLIEHTSHLPAMSAQPIAITNDSLVFDFKAANGYTSNGSSSSQKLLGGTYCLFAGNGNQVNSSGDINGGDQIPWLLFNGTFNEYKFVDYNLDGDVNGVDRILWNINNGSFSGIDLD